MTMSKGLPGRSFRSVREIIHDSCYALDIPSWFRVWPKFDYSHCDDAINFFDKHGWVIFRHVFEADELAQFRECVERSKANSFEGDLLSDPHINGEEFIFDDRVLKIVRELLRGIPCYFGDSSASVDANERGFHKDNPDREDQEAPDWRSNYSIIRAGLYLQDHEQHSGGLAIRDRSHTTVDNAAGRPVAIPTEPGDLVLWSLRTTHSGYAARMRGFPNIFIPNPVLNRIAPVDAVSLRIMSKLFRPPAAAKRVALFATFGLDDIHLHRYLEYLKTRQYAVARWQATTYSTAIRTIARIKNIKLLSIREEIEHLDLDALNETHAYFPWSDAS